MGTFAAILKDLESDPWYAIHHRFGMAGEGQAEVIQDHLLASKGVVLNIGCGPWAARIKRLERYCKFLVAADKSWSHIIDAKAKINPKSVSFLHANAECLPLRSNSFDHILALGLFAEIPGPLRLPVFCELHRICRQGGLLMVTNAVLRPKDQHIELGLRVGFRLVEDHEDACKAASGDIKRRYLLIFAKDDSLRSKAEKQKAALTA